VKDRVQGQAKKPAKRKRRLLPGLAVGEGYTQHPFDLEFGVRTSGLIAGRDMPTGHRHDRYNTAYYGVAPSVFRALIVRWRRCKPVAPIDEFTFIDFGAGMGRAVLLASELPFRKVVGVELNATLAGIARRNAARWRSLGRARCQVRIECRDAAEFKFPDGPCVAFLFNPFGAPVMRRLLAAMAEAFAGQGGELDVLYANNEQESVLRADPRFSRLYAGQVMRSRADAIADHRILANQPDGEYASANFEDCSVYRWVGARGKTVPSGFDEKG
jgi:predicted RNA methylase